MSTHSKFKTVRLPLELCERIDAAAGDVPRERWVRRVLERALESPVADRPASPSVRRGSVSPSLGRSGGPQS